MKNIYFMAFLSLSSNAGKVDTNEVVAPTSVEAVKRSDLISEPKIVNLILSFLVDINSWRPLNETLEASIVNKNWNKGFRKFALNYLSFDKPFNNLGFAFPFVMFIKSEDIPAFEFEENSPVTRTILNAFALGKEVAIVVNSNPALGNYNLNRPVLDKVIPSHYFIICLNKTTSFHIGQDRHKLPWFDLKRNVEKGSHIQVFSIFIRPLCSVFKVFNITRMSDEQIEGFIYRRGL